VRPGLSRGIVAGRTRKARLLALGVPLLNRLDPIRSAEEIAYVDLMSGGRLEVGLIKGTPFALFVSNANPASAPAARRAYPVDREEYLKGFGRVAPLDRFAFPGYVGAGKTTSHRTRVLPDGTPMSPRSVASEYVQNSVMFAGSPDDVVRQLKAFYDSRENVDSLELFAREVQPGKVTQLILHQTAWSCSRARCSRACGNSAWTVRPRPEAALSNERPYRDPELRLPQPDPLRAGSRSETLPDKRPGTAHV